MEKKDEFNKMKLCEWLLGLVMKAAAVFVEAFKIIAPCYVSAWITVPLDPAVERYLAKQFLTLL